MSGGEVRNRSAARPPVHFTYECVRLHREMPMDIVAICLPRRQLAFPAATSSALIVLKSMLVPSVRTTKKHAV